MSVDIVKLERFAAVLEEAQARHYQASYGIDRPELCKHETQVTVKPGRRWIKVDVGTSGKYMVDSETAEIVGIKAYGVPHFGHRYGTLDTIDEWNWGGYRACRKQFCCVTPCEPRRE